MQYDPAIIKKVIGDLYSEAVKIEVLLIIILVCQILCIVGIIIYAYKNRGK